MVTRCWLILIWVQDLILALDLYPTDWKERGERRLTSERIPMRCALEVIDDESPVVGDGDGVADVMQKMMASSGMR
jgi:hypothetical protein